MEQLENKEERIQKCIEDMKKDAVDVSVYKEIYATIPESYIVEKDVDMGGRQAGDIYKKYTKWKLHKEENKDIIQKLQILMKEKNLNPLSNQLAFNSHFEFYYVWTVYLLTS